jgi:hypothetical protein
MRITEASLTHVKLQLVESNRTGQDEEGIKNKETKTKVRGGINRSSAVNYKKMEQ